MTEAALGFSEWLHYTDAETRCWRAWFAKQPATVLDVPIGEAGTDGATIRGMLVHIFMVELVYGCMLLDEPMPDCKNLPKVTLEEVFQLSESAHQKLRAFVQSTNENDLKSAIKLGDPSVGLFLQPSKRKAFAHTMLHSTRHWAQVATVLRQHGHKQDWQHDFVFTNALP